MKIDIGDFVKIAHPGWAYTMFYNFFNFCDVDLDTISRYAYRQCPEENAICQVKGIFQHPYFYSKNKPILYVVQHIHNGKVYIMGVGGIVKRFRKYVPTYPNI